MSEDITPIRQQYLQIKRQYPDAILFFRLGDFYETFDADAELTSRELDIVLTSRPVAKGVRVPMAGVPYHAVESYLARLIEKGYHVAICEQIGDQPTKGLFPREVVRVVTPGTIVEPELLSPEHNNYLVALLFEGRDAGLAYADITTGDFGATQLNDQDVPLQLRSELVRLHPAELLLAEGNAPPFDLDAAVTLRPAWQFEASHAEERLKEQFRVATLDGFGLREAPLAARAASAILDYLRETQSGALKSLTSLSVVHSNDFMHLDAATQRSLELVEPLRQGKGAASLLSVLDHTVTPMGHRLLRRWILRPLLDLQAISTRQDGVGLFLKNGLLRAQLRKALRAVGDLERLASRLESGNAQPRDLVTLRDTLAALPGINALLSEAGGALKPHLAQFQLCAEELELLSKAMAEDPPATLQNSGIILPGFSAELDELVASVRSAKEWIANLEQTERDRTGIKNLKVAYNKVFGYYIEVSRSVASLVPSEYIRKQTLVNAERYITPQLKEYESVVLNAESQIHEVELQLFREVCARLSTAGQRFRETGQALGALDCLASLAEAAAMDHYVRPEMTADKELEIRGGRHPIVEHALSGVRFVPNDTVFEPGEIVRIITGPNMSGKSTYLRQVALIVLMAQTGSFVPAESARIGLVDRIFTRIGAQDEIQGGQSTFMVEMVETANILNHATSQSLIILDEIGRGTSTYDGLSIAWSVVEHIHNHPRLRARTLFATHYHELIELADFLPGVRNYNVAVSESQGKIIFLYQIVPGGSDRSYGIHVAQLSGLPSSLIERAKEILARLEASSGRVIPAAQVSAQQLSLFSTTNPIIEELTNLELDTLSPLAALGKLYEWQGQLKQHSDGSDENQD